MSKFKIIERIAVWSMIIFTVGALVLSAIAAIYENYAG